MEIDPSDSYEPLAEYFGLSDSQRRMPREGRNEPLWHNMVQQGRRQLKNQKRCLAASGRARWKLNAKGVALAEKVADRYPMHWR